MGKSRKESDARYINKLRKDAKNAGMSLKAYKASRWESVGWSYAIEVIRKRCKKRNVECTITAAGLKELWDKQNGICPITGWLMILRKTNSGLTQKTVTIDRINQLLGYIPNNIRLISFAANTARHIWSDDDLIRFCQAVLIHNPIEGKI